MSTQSDYKKSKDLHSFQHHANNAIAGTSWSTVKVFIAGPYSLAKFYGKPVSLPGIVPASLRSVPRGSFLSVGSQEHDTSPSAGRQEHHPQPRTAEENHRRHVKRKQSELKLLINTNFVPSTAAFITLTFHEKITDFGVVKRECQKLFKRLRKHAPNIKYLAIPEKHEDKSWHAHILTDRALPLTRAVSTSYIEKGTIRSKFGSWESLWKIGQVHQKALDNGGNLGASIAGYILKNSSDPDLSGHHFIWRSDNLQQPLELNGQDAVDWVQKVAANGDLPIYSYSCQNLEHIKTMDVFEFCNDTQTSLLNKAWWRLKKSAA